VRQWRRRPRRRRAEGRQWRSLRGWLRGSRREGLIRDHLHAKNCLAAANLVAAGEKNLRDPAAVDECAVAALLIGQQHAFGRAFNRKVQP